MTVPSSQTALEASSKSLLLTVLTSSVCAGLLIGALEGILAPRGGSHGRWTAALYAAPLGALVALPNALAIWVSCRIWIRYVAARRFLSMPSSASAEDADIQFQALVASSAFNASLNATIFVVAFSMMDRLTDRSLVLVLLCAVVAVSSALLLASRGLVLALFTHALRRLAAKRVRLPRSLSFRYGLFIAVPGVSLVMAATAKLRASLPIAVADLAGFVAVGLLTGSVIFAVNGLSRERLGKFAGIVCMLGVALLSLCLVRVREPLNVFHEGVAVPVGVKIVQKLSDVDFDGASSLLGGRDCAPFDAARGPAGKEVRGNGADEDCDGRDLAAEVDSSSKVRFSGRLSAKQRRRYNIIWIVVDALRADHMSQFGYKYRTTPALDELASESLSFRNAFSQSSATCYSMQSMFVGLDPASMEWTMDKVHQSSVKHLTLASRLSKLGYRTGAVANRDLTRRFHGILRGHDTIVDVQHRKRNAPGTKYEDTRASMAPRVLRASLELLNEFHREAPKDPFLLTLYMPDPHEPYFAHGVGRAKDFRKGPIGDYDSEIAYADQHIGVLIEQLRHHSSYAWNDTIVIVTADHGEEFGEHGGKSHARTCYVESVNVPLIVRVPGIEGQTIDTPVALIDVVPTVLELIGAEPHKSDLQGQSLLIPRLAPELVDQERPIFCGLTSYSGSQRRLRAVRSGRYKLFKDDVLDQELLFDVENDPAEKRDLLKDDVRSYADTLEKLRAQLAATDTGNFRDHTHF
jgi:arylsulfatase A-like enzyme